VGWWFRHSQLHSLWLSEQPPHQLQLGRATVGVSLPHVGWKRVHRDIQDSEGCFDQLAIPIEVAFATEKELGAVEQVVPYPPHK
jgi:hypothetical protein